MRVEYINPFVESAFNVMREVLSADEYAVAAPHFGLDRPPNFEGHAWHLRVCEPLASIAHRLAISLPDAQTRLVAAKAGLFAARARRVRPGLDARPVDARGVVGSGDPARAGSSLPRPRYRPARRCRRTRY